MKLSDKWLTFAEVAERLAITSRTIKNWMRRPARRQALLAARHGRQWRIPRPADEWLWEIQTSRNLKEAGIDLKPSWEMELKIILFAINNYIDKFLLSKHNISSTVITIYGGIFADFLQLIEK